MPLAEGDARQVPDTSEHLKDTSERPKSATEVLQECADPDLAEIVAACRSSPNIRQAVLTLIRSTSGKEQAL